MGRSGGNERDQMFTEIGAVRNAYGMHLERV